MKQYILKVAYELQSGAIDAKTAQTLLLGFLDVNGSANCVSSLDKAIMYLEADQSIDEEIDIKLNKLHEAKNIIVGVLKNYH